MNATGHWIELKSEADKPDDRYGRWFWRVRVYTGIGSGGLEVWEYNNVEDWDVGDGDESRMAGYISHVWSEPIEVVLPDIPPCPSPQTEGGAA